MLRNCACLVIAHMVDATQLCGGVGWGGDDDLWENVENPGSWSRVLCNPVNTYGNCMMQSARGQQPGTLFSYFLGDYDYNTRLLTFSLIWDLVI